MDIAYRGGVPDYNDRMKRTTPSRFAPLLLLTALAGCQRGPGNEPLVFGHPVPQIGPDQAAGMLELQAVRLAVDEANAAGGRRVEVLHADTADRPDAFLTQATRLLSVNRAAGLIGGPAVEQLKQMATPALVEQAVVVSSSGGTGALLNRAVFTVGVTPTEQGKALARFAAQELNAANATVVGDASRPVSATVTQAFAREFRRGQHTVTDETTYRDAKELPALAGRLAAAKPAAILFAGSTGDFAAFRQHLPKGSQSALFFGGEESDVAALAGAADHGEGVYAATAFLADDPAPRVQEFVKRFHEKTGQPPTAPAALAYDAARVLFEATGRAPAARPLAWHDELAPPARYECLTGPLTFGPDQGALRPVLVVQWRGGRPELRKRYDPPPPPAS